MLEIALKFIEEINEHGYQGYIIGGFVRDHILGISSNDIDVSTNATPKEIREIFQDSCLPKEDYGSVTVMKKGVRFEVTTFRKEIGYVDNRRPAKIEYIDDLYKDLLRRDFTVNTICMNSSGEIVDFLGGQDDINDKMIRSVGNAKEKFTEDSLRILRAVRFATVLNFQLDDEIIAAIRECKHLLKNLSYYRKKEELDKIFASSKAKEGIQLILDLKLDKDLEIENLSKVNVANTNSIIGIWSILNVSDKYIFNNTEKELIKDINDALELNNLDPMALYKYGLYVNSVAGEIKGLDIKDITESYNNLIIQKRKDINITSEDIMKILNVGPGSYLKEIYDNIEREILYRRLDNNYDSIAKYLVENFRDIKG